MRRYLEVLDFAVADVELLGGGRNARGHLCQPVALHRLQGVAAASSRTVRIEPIAKREQNKECIEQMHLPKQGLSGSRQVFR